jgi:protein-disulfide isomerase
VNALLALSFWIIGRDLPPPDARSLATHWRRGPAEERPPIAVFAKPAVVIVALAVGIGALAVTSRIIGDVRKDARDEAVEFLERMVRERPIDMSRFAGRPTIGPADARITIAVASDFQCSFCRALSARLDELRAQYPNDVRLIFLNDPVHSSCNPWMHTNLHEHACWLAKAGACLAEHGRFWEYHDLVYRRIPLPQVTQQNVRAQLMRMGIPPAALDACVASAGADSVIAADVNLAQELGMTSVPSVVINGTVKTGGIYPTTLRMIVNTILAQTPKR